MLREFCYLKIFHNHYIMANIEQQMYNIRENIHPFVKSLYEIAIAKLMILLLFN